MQHGQIGLQVDHRPRRLEPVHGVIAIDRAAAGGDDRAAQIDGQQYFLLEFPQPQVAVAFQQLLQGGPGAHLDIQVGIDKAQAGELGEHYAHGALAGAGHADQADGVCAAVRGSHPGCILRIGVRVIIPVSAPGSKALSASRTFGSLPCACFPGWLEWRPDRCCHSRRRIES